MAAYILRRLWQMVPTLLGVVLLVFVLFKFFGGDPAEILGGLNASPEQVASIRQQLGLDQPWWMQLWIFVQQIASFDWGRSWATNEPVAQLFATRLPATLTVMLPILLLDTLLAIPIALFVATRRGSLTDRVEGGYNTQSLSESAVATMQILNAEGAEASAIVQTSYVIPVAAGDAPINQDRSPEAVDERILDVRRHFGKYWKNLR